MAVDWPAEFEALVDRKTREASEAAILGFDTTELGDATGLTLVENAWSSRAFDGPFYVSPPDKDLPSISLVMVQSRDGNTVADDPSALGGGLTDKHLIYEGLSRVAADAVLAGSRTVTTHTFFSVWRPELVDLRERLGKPRHPAQVVVTGTGDLDVQGSLLTNYPAAEVFVLSTSAGARRLRSLLGTRHWVHVFDCGDSVELRAPLRRLRSEFQLATISSVGGRRTAATLLQQQLISDVFLTTSSIAAGVPDTPLHLPTAGRRLVLAKAGRERESGVRFQHWLI